MCYLSEHLHTFEVVADGLLGINAGINDEYICKKLIKKNSNLMFNS